MRKRGRRLRWRDVAIGPAFVGDLHTFSMQYGSQWVTAATLANNDPAAGLLLPDLFEPVLLGFAPLAFQLRGFERQEGPDGRYSVIQEWHCELP